MFFGKHPVVAQYGPGPVDGMMMGAPGQVPGQMVDGMMGVPGMEAAAGYAAPGMPSHFLHGTPGMPCPVAPGTAESVHLSRTGYDPCCPGRFEHVEYDVDVEPCPRQPQVHIVRKGETVYKIAQRYGLDWRELAGYNHLGNPDLIYPGQKLEIPPRY